MMRSGRNREKSITVDVIARWIGMAVIIVVLSCILSLGYGMYRDWAYPVDEVVSSFSFPPALLIDSRVVKELKSSDSYDIRIDGIEEKSYSSCVNVSGNSGLFISGPATSLFFVQRGESEFDPRIVALECSVDISFARNDVGGRSLLDVLAYPGEVFPWSTSFGIDEMSEGEELAELYPIESQESEKSDGSIGSVLLFEIPVKVKDESGEISEERVKAAAYSQVLLTFGEDTELLDSGETDDPVEQVICTVDRCIEITYSDS